MRYYALKFGLYLAYIGLRVKSALGFKVDGDDLADFELDYTPDTVLLEQNRGWKQDELKNNRKSI